MPVKAGKVKTKVNIKLVNGSQTVSGISTSAEDEKVYTLARQIAKLCKEQVDVIEKIVETEIVTA